ncbi:transcriptional regulator, HxlR family [Mucilaginibacter mallensis]|uniref:Transcriptional regulator, HxlR family n=1 Tax=Mucilaginibacter mallensis TaxID=652787 RepID=A0A1H1W8Q5_MUCMA|nr:helix-turn-helix domain-containing protein [Mucilaginibacter mallensis]SDS93020.1 transcriptional regulator, HxlR family [Mucilaginibacter mallensis]
MLNLENKGKYIKANDCPIAATIDVIGGKWKPIIIWLLIQDVKRFGELHRSIPGIALKVMNRQLKELEADGIIIRTAYPEVPPRVEYALSEKGKTLTDIMKSLALWSTTNILESEKAD